MQESLCMLHVVERSAIADSNAGRRSEFDRLPPDSLGTLNYISNHHSIGDGKRYSVVANLDHGSRWGSVRRDSDFEPSQVKHIAAERNLWHAEWVFCWKI